MNRPSILGRSAVRASLLVAGVVASIPLFAGSAFGGTVNRHYGPSPNGGYGETKGSLTYVNAKEFNYDITLNDLCPADGNGVSFYFAYHMATGNYPISDIKGTDTDGCGNGTREFTGTVTRTYRILSTQVDSCFTNNGNDCWLAVDASAWHDNPYA